LVDHKIIKGMKKILSLAVFLLVLTISVDAQRGAKFQKNVESMQIAFLTTELDLTPEESQKFWPIYNEYQREQKALKKKYKFSRNPEALSDEEADKMILASLDMEEKGVELKRKYYSKMRSVLPVQKIAMLKKAEREFKQKIIKQLERRKNRRESLRGEN